ncbi:alpha/beta hydrolase [Streptomyces sp. NPDC002643]
MAHATFRKTLRTLIAVPLLAWTALTMVPAQAAVPETDAPPLHLTGTLADGAVWIADVPADWNGELLLFSHGFGPLQPQLAPSEQARTALLDAGYALAGSSYDPNGSWWALNSAERDQFATLDAFTRAVRRPDATIAMGQSMGGLVAARMARDGGGRIDAALSLCGITAGAVDTLDQQLRAEVAIAELLLPGEPVELAGYANLAEAEAAGRRLLDAVTAAQATPEGRARIALVAALLDETDWVEGSAPPAPGDVQARQEQQYLGVRRVAEFLLWYGRYSIESAVGGNPSTTAGTDYPALLSRSRHAGVVRSLYTRAGLDLRADLAALADAPETHADLGARARLRATSTAGQGLAVPTLTVHTTADPLVPVEQEFTFARRIRAAGDGSLLRQAFVARPGHCAFTAAEVVASVRAVDHRRSTGRWDSVTRPRALNAAAAATGLGESAFVRHPNPPTT